MKITQIMLSRGFGGAERAFVDTACALADRGHDVQAICLSSFSHRKTLAEHPGIQTVAVAPINQYDRLGAIRIRSILKHFHPDILHVHLNRAAILGGWAASSIGIPWVGTFHNYYAIKNYESAAAIFAISEDVRRHAIEQGFSSKRVHVIPNFSRILPVDSLPSPNNTPIQILSYGRFVHKKGFDVLLKSFRALLDSGLDATLVLGGDGPDFEMLKTLSKDLDLSKQVIFKKWIDDIQAALIAADLSVIPSRDEPFGIVMLEAMACGVPIVTTRSQGPLQVLSDETTFFAEIDSVESLTNALQTAVKSPALREQNAKNALHLYRTTYCEQAVLPQLESLYRKNA